MIWPSREKAEPGTRWLFCLAWERGAQSIKQAAERSFAKGINITAMAHDWYLHSALVGLRNLAHSKGGVLGTLPKQVLAPQLGAASMIGQHHLPPPLQLVRSGHGLCLCSRHRHLRLGHRSACHKLYRSHRNYSFAQQGKYTLCASRCAECMADILSAWQMY